MSKKTNKIHEYYVQASWGDSSCVKAESPSKAIESFVKETGFQLDDDDTFIVFKMIPEGEYEAVSGPIFKKIG